MTTNATWWVRYTDPKNPSLGTQLLSLASPDLADPRRATRRAAQTAKARLAKRGVRAVIQNVQIVG